MPRARAKPTIEEIDASIETIRARADKEIAALEQRKTHVQASHFQRITRVARAAGCDLEQVSDSDLIAALKALNAPFQGRAIEPPAAPRGTDESRETEAPSGKRLDPKG
jgi:hypothetical protein